jgi:hypothetical protein
MTPEPPLERGRHGSSIDEVAQRLEQRLTDLEPDDANRHFLATYLRTTRAVGAAVASGQFEDPDWVERWDVAFAELYLDALERRDTPAAPEPWAVAFRAARQRPDLPPLRHVLLGINAHINFDLPQALLAVITDDEFADPNQRARRERDHAAVDAVLVARVAAEDAELLAAGGPRGIVDRALAPFNRSGTKRFLKEARAKVWSNAIELSRARRGGDPDELTSRLAQLSALSAAKLEELVAPGQVLLRLAVRGFGVRLAPGSATSNGAPSRPVPRHRSFDPRRVGRLERDAWVAYYQRRWWRLLVVSVALVQAGFRLGVGGTLRGSWHVLRANQLWAPVPDNDPEGARRHMAAFYRLVRERERERFDPETAAALEVEWWRVHRALQRHLGEPASESELVAALSELYAYVYSLDTANVSLAATERAAAMAISDRWVAQGCDPASADLELERAALVRSYAALLAAVHR